MAGPSADHRVNAFGSTLRRDPWWVELLPSSCILGAFGIYATLRAFEGKFYAWGPYLSPFYSPLIDPNHHWWRFSPALLILAGPLGFRATCYYYRKAYYRAFFLHPPACAVSEGGGGHIAAKLAFHSFCKICIAGFFTLHWCFSPSCGGTRFALSFPDGFGIGVGSLVLLANIVLLTLYTFSCHSLRHLAGGKLDCFSCTSLGRRATPPGDGSAA